MYGYPHLPLLRHLPPFLPTQTYLFPLPQALFLLRTRTSHARRPREQGRQRQEELFRQIEDQEGYPRDVGELEGLASYLNGHLFDRTYGGYGNVYTDIDQELQV